VDRIGDEPTDQAKPSVSDVISESFSVFDHQSVVTVPFEIESKRDVAFEESEYMRFASIRCVLGYTASTFLQR
jgi:hypothetical protein